jgi:branched-chain amino acid transport system substrate-binding protein
VAQAFAGIQVYVESLIEVDAIYGLATLTNEQIRLALNTVMLNGEYETPMGTVSFTPQGEVVQARFYVAQVQMDADGQTGRFVFLE